MIQKITKIICDNCGQGIYDVIGNPPREYTDFAKNMVGLLNIPIVAEKISVMKNVMKNGEINNGKKS